MSISIAALFALAICYTIEFIIPDQIALAYAMLGGPSREISRKAISNQKYKKVKMIRFIVLLLPLVSLTYYTIDSNIIGVLSLMIFIGIYSGFISLVEIRLVRRNHLAGHTSTQSDPGKKSDSAFK